MATENCLGLFTSASIQLSTRCCRCCVVCNAYSSKSMRLDGLRTAVFDSHPKILHAACSRIERDMLQTTPRNKAELSSPRSASALYRIHICSLWVTKSPHMGGSMQALMLHGRSHDLETATLMIEATYIQGVRTSKYCQKWCRWRGILQLPMSKES